MSSPPYVTHLRAGAIILANLDRPTVRRLRAAGLDIDYSWFTGYGQLAIEPALESGLPSRDQEDKLMALARLGIAFAYDYKQGMDPASQMLELCRSGRYVGTFKQVAFTGKGIRIVEMPAGDEAWRRSLRESESPSSKMQDFPEDGKR